MATGPNSPKGALMRHGFSLRKDPQHPRSTRRDVLDSDGRVVLTDASVDEISEFCERNNFYLPE